MTKLCYLDPGSAARAYALYFTGMTSFIIPDTSVPLAENDRSAGELTICSQFCTGYLLILKKIPAELTNRLKLHSMLYHSMEK
jgi:hypothetical protein